jgi:two-component system sensor histidine kinase DctS
MAERLKILLVDNDSGNINWLLSFKDQIPADYTLAKSIKEVKEIQTQEVFDVILLNLSLPDCSGLKCLKKVKELKPDIPVVVLVAPEQASEALESSKNGAQGFIILGSLEGEFITSVIYQAYQRQKIVNEIRESQRQYSSLISNLPGFVYRCQNDAN